MATLSSLAGSLLGSRASKEKEYEKFKEEYVKYYLPPSSGVTPTPLSPSSHPPLTPSPWPPYTPTRADPLREVLSFCVDNDIWIRRTGSQLVEGIIPNDYDYVVEDTEGVLPDFLSKNGWWYGGSPSREGEFQSWKITGFDKTYNIIICHEREFFKKYLIATELLKKLQPKTKEERINIFDTIFGKDEKSEVPL